MAKIHYIGESAHTTYQCEQFSVFQEWFSELKIIAHDVETNVVQSILDRELRVVQYSDYEGLDNWVLQWSYLTTDEQQWLKDKMSDSSIKYLIFASQFEGGIWKKYGVDLANIWDCYIEEQILNTGYTQEKGMFSLAGTLKRRFDVDISKAEQLQFDDNIITDPKIQYAATDTLKLGQLHAIQKLELQQMDSKTKLDAHKGLIKTSWWDNEFVLAIIDMEFEGVTIDQNKWIANYNKALPLVQASEKTLNDIVKQEFKSQAIQADFLYTKDTFDSKIWSSSKKKLGLLSLVFSGLEATAKTELKKYLKETDPKFPEDLAISGKAWNNSDYPVTLDDEYSILKILILMDKDTKEEFTVRLNKTFFDNFKDYMVENELVILANTLKLNWGSPPQRLQVFKWINPSIQDTTAQTVEDNMLKHNLFRIFADFQEKYGLVTKFGLKYLRHVDRDGKIRTSFNTVLATGRLSAREPNLLQLPRNQDYRDCIITEPGTKIVGADFNAEELVIIAVITQEPIWLEALATGKDLHSINAELIFEDKWRQAAEPDCEYFAIDSITKKQKYKKCNCKKHKELRYAAKTIGFGLSYGLSAHGLAIQLHITKSEATKLINKFFTTFKSIQKFFMKWGHFGANNLYITEPVTGRIRFFNRNKLFVDNGRESIVRESMNFPEMYGEIKSDKLLENPEEDNQQLIQNLNGSGEFND